MFIAGRVVVKRYIFLFFRFNDGQPKRPFRARRVAQLPATGSVIEVVETVAGCIWRGARGDRQHTERSNEREREKRPFLVRTGKRPFGMNEEEEKEE